LVPGYWTYSLVRIIHLYVFFLVPLGKRINETLLYYQATVERCVIAADKLALLGLMSEGKYLQAVNLT